MSPAPRELQSLQPHYRPPRRLEEPPPPVTVTLEDEAAVERAARAILGVQRFWDTKERDSSSFPGDTAAEILEEHVGATNRRWHHLCSLASRRAEELGATELPEVERAVRGLGVVGDVLARRIALRFPTLDELYAARQHELEEVEYVGPEKAATLYARLHAAGNGQSVP